jgi:pyruvate dehydrogenase E2 component (dihydrolipoamide acetyltransferase)
MIFAPPSVRRLAREHDIDIETVDGSGPAGRITKADIEAAIDRDGRRVSRGAVDRRRGEAKSTVPHATYHDTAVVSGLVGARDRLQPLADERGIDLTAMPLLLACVAATLDAHPLLASRIDTDELHYRSSRDIGVAIAVDGELTVPVIPAADRTDMLTLAQEYTDRVEQARQSEPETDPDERGVITVTEFGAIGSEHTEPTIVGPQTAMLGVGTLRSRPVVAEQDGNETVVAEPTVPLSLAVDSRAISGPAAATFLSTLTSYLEDPAQLPMGE